MRLKNETRITIPGWLGGIHEDVEPSSWDPKKPGILDRGLNFMPVGGGVQKVRGGSWPHLTFAEGDISEVLGIWPFSPTGAIAIAFSATNAKHYAYALTDSLAFALPNNSAPTELGSRVELGSGWATATAGRPNGDELFEKLYIADDSASGRRPQVALGLSGGALVATTRSYNLDGTGGNDAPMKPSCLAVFASVVFSFGWDSEANSFEPAIGRHSLLGVDPSAVGGYDKDAWTTFGAEGQAVRAARAGNTILLVAKANELYRLTGSGRGLPGWQFAVQALNNSEGRGCANAHALAHVDGTWYGAGAAGPFLTDGVTVQDLLPPRKRSWASVDLLETAFVRHHPDRQCVLFGFHVIGSPSRAQRPFELWQWDLVRQTWAPTLRFPQSFHVVSAIASGVSSGPSDNPSSPEQQFDWGEFEFEHVTGTFNAGDDQATTEVWMRQANGATVLVGTVPAGIQRFRVPAGISKISFVKLRHVKGGAAGDFSGEVAFFTRLLAPQVAVGTPSNDGLVRADFLNYVEGATLNTFDSSGFENTYPDAPAGFQTEHELPNDACYVTTPPDQGALYWASIEHPAWPAGSHESAEVECHTLAHKCAGSIETLAPEPRQRLERGGMALDSITLNYFPARANTNFKVQYRVNGTLTWLDGETRNSGPSGQLALTEVTITGLTHSKKYDVRVLNVASAVASAEVVMYTKLATPTINTIATAGTPGTPVVNITATPATAAKDLFLYNARGTFQAMHAAVSTVQSYQSTVGVCGAQDRYFARAHDASWPEGWMYSDAATADIEDPCVVS